MKKNWIFFVPISVLPNWNHNLGISEHCLEIFLAKKSFLNVFLLRLHEKIEKITRVPSCEKYENFFENFFFEWMISLLYPFLLSMKELLLTICVKNEKIFLKANFSKGGTLVIFSIFSWSRKRKTFKNDFLPKKFQGSVQICLNYDFNLVKLKSGQKFFLKIIFLKFSIFEFQNL